MSDALEHESPVSMDAIARWAELVGVRIARERLPAVAAYLGEIQIAIEALDGLDLRGADFPGSFDPAWVEAER